VRRLIEREEVDGASRIAILTSLEGLNIRRISALNREKFSI